MVAAAHPAPQRNCALPARGERKLFWQLPYPVHRVPPVAGEGPNLRRPAAGFDRLGPLRARKHMRAVDLVDRGMARTLVRNFLFFAADAHRERLALKPGDRMHARHFEEIGHVLGIVDFVEQSFLVGIDIHAGDEQVSGFDRHRRPSALAVTEDSADYLNRSAGGAISVTRSRMSFLFGSGVSVISRGSSRAVQA